MEYEIEMKYCRRCGAELDDRWKTAKGLQYAYICKNGHKIFYTNAMGAAIALFNDKGQVLMVERAKEAKGMWDLPGGILNPDEFLEEALEREVREEAGLEPDQYSEPEYLSSAVNTYHYDNEVVPVMAATYRAQLKAGAKPRAGDDAARIWFADLETLDLDRVYSVAGRKALAELQKSA